MRPTRVATPSSTIVLLPVLLISLAALVLVSIQIVLRGDLPGDMDVLLAAMSIRNPTLTQVIGILTFMGSAVPTFLVCIGLSLVEWRGTTSSPLEATVNDKHWHMRRLRAASWPFLAYSGTMITNIAMRLLIGRLPPHVESIVQLLPELQADFQRYAYPSGHAVTVFVTYSALAISAHRHSFLNKAALILALVVIIGVGFGRLYLGVHWPSDVLGGYLVAVVWVSFALIFSDWRISAQ